MKVIIKKYIIDPIWNTFFPPVCFLCDTLLPTDREIVCRSCLKNLPKFQNIHLNSFDILKMAHIYILYDYENGFRTLMHLYKYKHYLTLAKYFAIEALHTFPELKNTLYEAMVPVPLHKTRYRERGYNQSALLAEQLSTLMNVPVLNDLLIRNHYTQSQTNLNKEERVNNVSGAFSFSHTFTAEKILLIDDVITTGSTVNACTQVLMSAGVKMVDVFALANPKISQSVALNNIK